MILLKSRSEREKIIVQAMIKMYCLSNHTGNSNLCADCQTLSEYAAKRLLSCMYGEIKPVCKECPVHCYSPHKREQMRLVMRFSGPRMLYRKPYYAIIHAFDNLKGKNYKPSIVKQKK